jgi:hypothetical protein
MSPSQLARIAALLLFLPLASALAQPDSDTNVVEEQITDEGGAIKVCGEGDGLEPCRDANGQTYAEEVRGPSMASESDDEVAAEAARVRAESPQQLDNTISEEEQGYNPDIHATEGLPD